MRSLQSLAGSWLEQALSILEQFRRREVPDQTRDIVLILKDQFERHQKDCDRRYEKFESDSRIRHVENKEALAHIVNTITEATEDQNTKIDRIMWASLSAAGGLLLVVLEIAGRYFLEHMH